MDEEDAADDIYGRTSAKAVLPICRVKRMAQDHIEACAGIGKEATFVTSKAAEVFLQGYEKDPKGGKAPDSLLKLAMSLGQLGQNKEACAAIDKLFIDFPQANSSLKRTAVRQQRQMNCKQ